MYESTKKLLSPLPHEKTKISMIWIIGIVAIAFVAFDCFAQSTPDWRPINRVYKNDGVTVGSVGSAGQIKVGHTLSAISFPLAIRTDNTKLAYWNFDNSLNESFTGGRNFTATNSYTSAAGIAGTSNTALTLNGTNQYLSVTSSTLDGGNADFTVGAWMYLSDWVLASNTSFFAFGGSVTDRVWLLYFDVPNQSINVQISSDGTAVTYPLACKHGVPDNTPAWRHVVARYVGASKTWSVFVDGIVRDGCYGTGGNNLRNATTDTFKVNASFDGSTTTGATYDELFFTPGTALSDVEIWRLSRTKIDHNKNLIAKRQDWHFKHQHLGIAGNPYQTLPFVWFDPTDANSLFVDFSDLDATDKVDIRLYDLQQ